MSIRHRRNLLLAAGLLASTASLNTAAHHSFAEFDAASTVLVEGRVKEWRLLNPHAMMTLTATDENGQVTEWKIEFDGLTHLGRRGWDEETFRTGERLAITGNPAKSGSPFMFFNNAVREDGSELLRPHTESLNAIEEERRQRRLQRESSQ